MEKIIKVIKEYNLLENCKTLGVAVSGGSDSMALLHFLNANKNKLKVNILVINIEHGIRGEASKQDSAFVKKYCDENNIEIKCFEVDALKKSEEDKKSIETSARELRYEIFNELLKTNVVQKIAIAHHKDDQSESVLMHLFRGSGINGIAGMRVDRGDGIIRPMLFTDKKDILKYLELNKIPYVTDETNHDLAYRRNFVRNEIFPKIEKAYPRFKESVINLSQDAYEDNLYLNKIAKKFVVVRDNGVVITDAENIDTPILKRAIFLGLSELKVYKDITRKNINDIVKLVKEKQSGRQVNLIYNVIAYNDYGSLFLTKRQKEEKVLNSTEFKLGQIKVGDFIVRNELVENNDFKNKKANELFVSSSLLEKGLVLRTRKDGDIFEKFGGGTKKLKDYFIDKKIPQRQRDSYLLLAKDNNVYAILGLEISKQARVLPKEQAVKITIEEVKED